MDVRDVEQFEYLLRKVVREELSVLLGHSEPQAVRNETAVDRFHPFSLSDSELAQAESLLPELERPILRKRVMAARLEKLGNLSAATKMRRQADGMALRLSTS